MSFNTLTYDTCSYSRKLRESVSILGYILNEDRYLNNSQCRHNFGLVGGTGVSHVTGNMVDLESDMRGQTRYLSKCIDNQYKPLKPGQLIHNDKTAPIDTTAIHLPACQMFPLKSVQLPPNMEY